MPNISDAKAIITAYQSAVAAVRQRVEQFARFQWGNMADTHDDEVAKMINAILPVVLAGEKQTALLTGAYMSRVRQAVTGAPALPSSLKVDDVTGPVLRGGTPMDEVYRRPAVAVYTALRDGRTYADARSEGINRLVDLVRTDMQLAKTHAARASVAGDKQAVGLRRVLTGAENCALCVLASTQRYHVNQLMPVHPGCDCSVCAIYGDTDPGQVINQGLLDQTNALLQEHGLSGPGTDLRKVAVRDHGEYGPTLTWQADDFTGPADI